MGRLREIPRTAAFAWSTGVSQTLLATGTRAGAVNADFSDETKLEIWDLETKSSEGNEAKPLASLTTDSRYVIRSSALSITRMHFKVFCLVCLLFPTASKVF